MIIKVFKCFTKYILLIVGITLLFISVVQAKTLLLGMSAALTGPVRDLGQGMKLGIETYLNHVNQIGGVAGNKLQLIALDDRYEPYLAKRNMLKLARNKNVLAIVGNVGTPTAIVSVPIANEENILLFGTFSGADVLRNTPPDRYVMNYRASYAQEAAMMINSLIKAGIKPDQMAFFTQDDSYGDSGYLGAVHALELAGYSNKIIEQIPHGRYPHNTSNIEAGLQKILEAHKDISVFIMVGTYKPVVKFIKQAKQYYPKAHYLNISFVGAEALAAESCKKNRNLCAEYSKNIIMTQVVPHYDSDIPIAKEFIKNLQHFAPKAKPTFAVFEGYIVAKIITLGIKRAGSHPTRESLIDGLETITEANIGIGFPITFSKRRHQVSDKVWITVMELDQRLKWKQVDNIDFRRK
jgi:ABC-type branched-subunit amino acid transport system substrate-binding protein